MITSRQNAKIKLVNALVGRSKERQQAQAFIAEGVRLIEDALKATWPFRFTLYSETINQRGRGIVRQLEARGIDVEAVSDDLMQSLSDTESCQGLLAVLDLPFSNPLPEMPDFVLIPDQIRDPGNLGSLLRAAAAAGVQAALIPPETTDPYAPKVVRAGMGAHFHMPVHLMAWEEIQRFTRTANLTIYLAAMQGRACWEADFKKSLALIVGGEAKGASEQARRLTHEKVNIPMPGKMESLNAAVAGAILMFEVVHQRKD